MIKINLLYSVTERHSGAAVAVERKVGSPTTRLLVMSLTVGFLLVLISGFDIIDSNWKKTDAETRLEEQKQIAAQLESVMKEQKELEAKIQNIDMRIEAIKKLRNSQAGPSAVLNALSERIAMNSDLYLESVEQSGETLTIKGNSLDEAAITRFGSSLEFSNGLFSNLSIETQRKEVATQASAPAPGPNGQPAETPKMQVVNFTIRTSYTPSKAGAPDGNPTTAQNAPQNGAPNQPAAQPNNAAPAQVAKNQ